MSGDVQARRGGAGGNSGGKLKNRNKKRAMMQELEKQEYHQEKLSLDTPAVNNDASNVFFDKKQQSLKRVRKQRAEAAAVAKARQGPKGKHQQFYYEEPSDEEEEEDDVYDIAAPKSSSTSRICGVCAKALFLALLASIIGMATLYVQSPNDFWATVEQIDTGVLKPLGANVMWPDLQGINHKIEFNLQEFLQMDWKSIAQAPVQKMTTMGEEAWAYLITSAEAIVASSSSPVSGESSADTQQDQPEQLEPSFNAVDDMKEAVKEPEVVQETAYTLGATP